MATSKRPSSAMQPRRRRQRSPPVSCGPRGNSGCQAVDVRDTRRTTAAEVSPQVSDVAVLAPAATEDHDQPCLGDDLQVKGNRPIAQIGEVEITHLAQAEPVASGDLPGARESRPDDIA